MSMTETTTAPLLAPRPGAISPTAGGARTAASVAMLLSRFSGHSGASMLVRETVALQLEQTRAAWGHSFLSLALEITWSLVFVAFTVIMLVLTSPEKPDVPLRAWICGTVLLRVMRTVLVCMKYRRRNRRSAEDGATAGGGASIEDDDGGDRSVGDSETSHRAIDTIGFKDFVTLFCFMWWTIGFYFVVSAEENVLQCAPVLYWSTMGYLALEMFPTIMSTLFACFLGFGACFFFPCIIALMYIIAGQEGASETDISVLPKYRFEVLNDEEQPDVGAGIMVPIESSDQENSVGRVLSDEDADCCICLGTYENGAELLLLPCNHHFHGVCIAKWLKINATCPLCKYNIKRTRQVV